MRLQLILAALATTSADDHIHASHADIELARDFRVDKHHKIIVSNIGDEDLAFYYLGNEGNHGMEAEEPTWDMSETLCAVLGPDEEAGRFVRFRDSFVVRSADMKWRVRFHIIPSRFIEQPYGITFSNPMTEGESIIELKHHDDAPVVLLARPGARVLHAATRAAAPADARGGGGGVARASSARLLLRSLSDDGEDDEPFPWPSFARPSQVFLSPEADAPPFALSVARVHHVAADTRGLLDLLGVASRPTRARLSSSFR